MGQPDAYYSANEPYLESLVYFVASAAVCSRVVIGCVVDDLVFTLVFSLADSGGDISSHENGNVG